MLDEIEQFVQSLSGKKKGAAVQDCPLAKGAICIIVTRSDTGEGIADVRVTLEGPTPGAATTDHLGIALFEERHPGGYRFELEFPADKEHYNYDKDAKTVIRIPPYQQGSSVSASQITIEHVEAYPTGDLEVEVLVEDQHGARSRVPDVEEIYTRNGPQSLRQPRDNPYLFARVKCGRYEVSAGVPQDHYTPSVGTAPKPVTVPEGGTGKAVIVVGMVTWIAISLVGEDGEPIADEKYQIELPDGSLREGYLDAEGKARLDDIPPGNCKVTFPELDQEAWEPA